MSTWLAIVALVVAVGALAVAITTRRRLVRSEQRLRALEGWSSEVDSGVAEAHADARSAGALAQRAATAAGVEDEPPRVPLEPLTGRVVRVVAFGAGARRAIARLAHVRDDRGYRSERSA